MYKLSLYVQKITVSALIASQNLIVQFEKPNLDERNSTESRACMSNTSLLYFELSAALFLFKVHNFGACRDSESFWNQDIPRVSSSSHHISCKRSVRHFALRFPSRELPWSSDKDKVYFHNEYRRYNWLPTHYSFVLVQTSLPSLVSMC